MVDSEKKFAAFLTAQGKAWKAQPKTFRFAGISYRPDFYCPGDDTYYEVKTNLGNSDRRKMIAFRKHFPNIRLKMVNPDGSLYYGRGAVAYVKEFAKVAQLLLHKDITELTQAQVRYLEKRAPRIYGTHRPMFGSYAEACARDAEEAAFSAASSRCRVEDYYRRKYAPTSTTKEGSL